ncbi:MAG: RrF2 family transcriptional regulator [Armatimonadota bacterium]
MNFTAKDEYGIKAVMHLAARVNEGPIQAREIARIEGIPEQFLEQVLASLRRSGIIRSIRGASGGYELAGSPREITAGDIIRSLSGPIIPTQSSDESSCPSNPESCVVADLWQKVQSAISDILDNTTIQDMIDEKIKRQDIGAYMMYI